jgi:hypothetical protein
MAKLVEGFLPKPQILHPWPSVQFAVICTDIWFLALLTSD